MILDTYLSFEWESTHRFWMGLNGGDTFGTCVVFSSNGQTYDKDHLAWSHDVKAKFTLGFARSSFLFGANRQTVARAPWIVAAAAADILEVGDCASNIVGRLEGSAPARTKA